MKVDLGATVRPAQAADLARRTEAAGFDALWAAETNHDPFLSCALAAASTESIEIGTAIAIAFARSPMTLANTAHDLQELSGGRFVLGLGSQIRPHIEKRYSMPWSHPARRMREFIQALRAIWDTWEHGTPLEFEGEFYRHTLMPPMFTPRAHGHGAPKVFLAGVGPRMTEVAGEVADGFICHGFSSERYLRERTLPALARGCERAGRSVDDLEIVAPGFVVTGVDDEAIERAKRATRRQMAFYGSTPAYRPVLELHGWGDLQAELHAMSKDGAWERMGALITDEILETFAVVGRPEDIGPELHRRYGDIANRVTSYERPNAGPAVNAWTAIAHTLRQPDPTATERAHR
ncbi:LLM class F420-dependent oxidoreductase [Acidimicrobiia bacterium EGI L10123]|uniref:LLM class F420-dependent oxidoreductase n=1 Tax=Salinilacustrithrix flava TaxID=2957203 RepID=UPI003D7C320C|nr:LLM class F420-dependent oxidoreductase [Acidimicrobiia bacterium EGI L10123]